MPTDPLYAAHQSGYATAIGLPDAWAHTRGSSAVIVAVLDTGVLSTSSDLAGRLLPAQSTTGSVAFSDSTLTGSMALHHGTYMASAIAMGIGNAVGGAGMGEFMVLPITVTNSNANNQSSWIADGIRLAADQGARVINVSHSTLSYGLLDDAAAYARERGALTFIASGNSSARINRPAYANLIFVGGTDTAGARWETGAVGSSWGPYVDLSAPAAQILAGTATSSSSYGLVSGTSMATALASGAAALAWSANPLLTPDQMESLLYSTADDFGAAGYDEVFGHGRINVGRLVNAAAVLAVPEPNTALLLVMGMVACGLARRKFGFRPR